MTNYIPNLTHQESLLSSIKILIQNAQNKVIQSINTTMVCTYFEIGRLIVEYEQNGNLKAKYGSETLKRLSQQLTAEFGRGFSLRNIESMRKFYIVYRKTQTPSAKLDLPLTFQLSWSHYVFLIRLNESERRFYESESIHNNWSLRELKRQFDTGLYDRLRSKKHKPASNDPVAIAPTIAIKDPYILEFLGLKEDSSYSESELEQSIIDKIEHFLLELGNGFAFMERQRRFTFDEQHFFVDLVFYNRILKCFVLIDLKIGSLKHQDLGQIQMYVNYYDRFVKTTDENPTIGIVLCKDKNDSIVEITLPENNKQIFASQYKTYLPSKEALQAQLNNATQSLLKSPP